LFRGLGQLDIDGIGATTRFKVVGTHAISARELGLCWHRLVRIMPSKRVEAR
jgi:hypothetical protein